MGDIELLAPFDAWCGPLSEVPDEAFASGQLGEGLALDPFEGVLRAPFDGTIEAIAATRHAVTLRHPTGAEVLVHVGIDTVKSGGRGFECHRDVGAQVSAGDVLLTFDLDLLAHEARSLISPVIVLGDSFRIAPLHEPKAVKAGQPIARLTGGQGEQAEARPTGTDLRISALVKVALANGLHARPAAAIVSALKTISSEVSLSLAGRTANGRSITSLLKLDARFGDEVFVEASGSEAEDALAVLRKLFAQDHSADPTMPIHSASAQPPVPTDGAIAGVRVSSGAAMGRAFQLRQAQLAIPSGSKSAVEERAALVNAVARLSDLLRARSQNSNIAGAHLSMLTDPDLQHSVFERIDEGMNAAQAWRAATLAEAEALEATGNPLLIERRADLADVERQFLEVLLGQEAAPQAVPDGAILVTDEILPSDFHRLDISRLAGIVTARGGPTSHAAILAASKGIPMVVGCGAAVLSIPDGTLTIVDGDRRLVHPSPSDEQRTRFVEHAEERRAINLAQRAAASAICRTSDGERIEVFANCGSEADAIEGVAHGAEGCGLLRTEFLFLSRDSEPGIEEQASAYRAIAVAMGGKPLIVRTLDAGSDKPLPFLPVQAEENPALGLRGIRLSLAMPGLLDRQFRAILLGVPEGQRRIMVPMISTIGELRAAKAILRQVEQEMKVSSPTPLGIMVETPAAALMAPAFAREADFLSIGSNDLAQYCLAADRQNSSVAANGGALDPAVLRLIFTTAQAGRTHSRDVGLCGSLASDPKLAVLLVGLGITELSAAPASIPAIKAALAKVSTAEAGALAANALLEIDTQGVCKLIEEHCHAIGI